MAAQKSPVQFEIQVFPLSSNDPLFYSKSVQKMRNISRLEKIFLLALVQGAKYYPITRQENLEFLGEIDGGAKIT